MGVLAGPGSGTSLPSHVISQAQHRDGGRRPTGPGHSLILPLTVTFNLKQWSSWWWMGLAARYTHRVLKKGKETLLEENRMQMPLAPAFSVPAHWNHFLPSLDSSLP